MRRKGGRPNRFNSEKSRKRCMRKRNSGMSFRNNSSARGIQNRGAGSGLNVDQAVSNLLGLSMIGGLISRMTGRKK